MNMYDLGKKPEYGEEPMKPSDEVYYPEIYLRDLDIPEFPRGEFEVTCVMEKKSECYDGEEVEGVTLCVKSIGKPKKKRSQYLTMDEAKEMLDSGELE